MPADNRLCFSSSAGEKDALERLFCGASIELLLALILSNAAMACWLVQPLSGSVSAHRRVGAARSKHEPLEQLSIGFR